ncbi:hypothetical protein L483_11770 [Pseudomonas putida H8234]|nr:hypothetical protein L483_11770 [Pseudomonas putida H8234]
MDDRMLAFMVFAASRPDVLEQVHNIQRRWVRWAISHFYI